MTFRIEVKNKDIEIRFLAWNLTGYKPVVFRVHVSFQLGELSVNLCDSFIRLYIVSRAFKGWWC